MHTKTETILSVSELTAQIKKNLESSFFRLKIKGEITNLRKQASGHIYFTLKDSASQVSAVLFQGSAKLLSRLPKDGDQVIVEGEISVYAPRGSYQIIVRKVEFDGVGDLLLKLHALKEALKRQGYFDQERKKRLPPFPKTIGVITSPTGAVIQDILTILSRRSQTFHLILNPVRVQGDGAAKEIALAIEEFDRYKLADVLIVGRGGGSLEDLMPFNEKCVADAIFKAKIPIISAVGHETDFSIADYVADVRAPTPSAAAEIVVKERSALLSSLERGATILRNLTLQSIKRHRLQIEKFSMHPKFSDPYTLLGTFNQKIDEMRDALTQALIKKTERARLLCESKKQLLTNFTPKITLKRKKEDLQKIKRHLISLNPKTILKKGYCIPFQENKKSVIMAVKEIKISQKITLLFHDGEAKTTVEEV